MKWYGRVLLLLDTLYVISDMMACDGRPLWCQVCAYISRCRASPSPLHRTMDSVFIYVVYFMLRHLAELVCVYLGPSADPWRWLLPVLGVCNRQLRYWFWSVLRVDRRHFQPSQRPCWGIEWRWWRWRSRSVDVKLFCSPSVLWCFVLTYWKWFMSMLAVFVVSLDAICIYS